MMMLDKVEEMTLFLRLEKALLIQKMVCEGLEDSIIHSRYLFLLCVNGLG